MTRHIVLLWSFMLIQHAYAADGEPGAIELLLRGVERRARRGGRGLGHGGEGRSEDCCHGNGCYFDGCSWYGYNGCGAGQYQTGTTSNACTNYIGTCDDCPAGQHKIAGCMWDYTVCAGTACAAGKFGPAGATTAAETSCTSCTAGTYSAQTGRTKCTGTVCAAGKFAPAGATTAAEATCESCPGGWFQSATGQSACEVCPDGFGTRGWDGWSTCEAQCADGQYLLSDQCVDCTEGHYCPGWTTAPVPCGAGTYQDQISHTSDACKNCPEGWKQGATGQSVCESCGVNMFSTAGKASCTSCVDGTVEVETSVNVITTQCTMAYTDTKCSDTQLLNGTACVNITKEWLEVQYNNHHCDER